LWDIFSTQWNASGPMTANGTTRQTATPIQPGFNEFYTVTATNNASVLPPATLLGQMVFVINISGATLNVFGNGNDIIFAGGVTGISLVPGVSMASGVRSFFICTRPGYWTQMLSA